MLLVFKCTLPRRHRMSEKRSQEDSNALACRREESDLDPTVACPLNPPTEGEQTQSEVALLVKRHLQSLVVLCQHFISV